MTTHEAQTTRRLGRPPRGTEGEITTRILNAAGFLFSTRGFEAVSIDDIASEANISKKTFYSRFASKSDLFEAFVARYAERTLPGIEAIRDGGRSTLDALHAIAAGALEAVLTPEFVTLHRSVIAEAGRFPELARVFEGFGYPRIVAVVERCLENGVRRGEVAVEDVRFAADYFMAATVRGPLDRATLGLERAEFTHVKRENLKRALDLFMAGCLPRPTVTPERETERTTRAAQATAES